MATSSQQRPKLRLIKHKDHLGQHVNMLGFFVPPFRFTTLHHMEVFMHRALRQLAAVAALTTLTLGTAWAQKPMPAATPAEQATLQKFVDAYMSGLEDNDFYDVTAEEVALRIKGGKKDFVVIDVRVPKDKKFDLGHVPGAKFVNILDIAKPATLAQLPRDKEIILHCDTGQQQNKALTALRLLGFNAYAMKWGYLAWAPAAATGTTLGAIQESITPGYPVEK